MSFCRLPENGLPLLDASVIVWEGRGAGEVGTGREGKRDAAGVVVLFETVDHCCVEQCRTANVAQCVVHFIVINSTKSPINHEQVGDRFCCE